MKKKFVIRVCKKLYSEVSSNDFVDGVATLSYYSFVSLFPALLILISIISLLPIDNLVTLLETNLYIYFPEGLTNTIENVSKKIRESGRAGIISFGFIVGIYTVSNGLSATIRQLNRVFDVHETRSFLRQKLVALGLFLGLFFILISTFGVGLLGEYLIHFFVNYFGLEFIVEIILEFARGSILFVTTICLFLVIYKYGPNKRIKIRAALVGSIFSGSALLVSTVLFGYYLGEIANFSSVYGNIGTFIALILWLHLLCAILILGAKVSRAGMRYL